MDYPQKKNLENNNFSILLKDISALVIPGLHLLNSGDQATNTEFKVWFFDLANIYVYMHNSLFL